MKIFNFIFTMTGEIAITAETKEEAESIFKKTPPDNLEKIIQIEEYTILDKKKRIKVIKENLL